MTVMLPEAPPGIAPGWYPDPWDGRSLRWWDGREWTTHTSPAAHQWARPGQNRARPAEPDPDGWFPPLRPLPVSAAVLATVLVALVTAGNVLADALADYRLVVVATGLATFAISTFGFPGAGWFASWRWGSRHVGDDLGLRARWIDLPLGVGGAVALTATVIIGGILIQILGLPQGSNLDEVREAGRNPLLFLLLAVLAGVIAPVTEEILFRGVLLRGLSSRFGRVGATVGQAAVFGAAHLTVSQGWGNVTMVVILGAVGLLLGCLAQLTGRLTPGMVAHSLFNLGQLGLLWLTLG